jgi:hypothetical protein
VVLLFEAGKIRREQENARLEDIGKINNASEYLVEINKVRETADRHMIGLALIKWVDGHSAQSTDDLMRILLVAKDVAKREENPGILIWPIYFYLLTISSSPELVDITKAANDRIAKLESRPSK